METSKATTDDPMPTNTNVGKPAQIQLLSTLKNNKKTHKIAKKFGKF